MVPVLKPELSRIIRLTSLPIQVASLFILLGCGEPATRKNYYKCREWLREVTEEVDRAVTTNTRAQDMGAIVLEIVHEKGSHFMDGPVNGTKLFVQASRSSWLSWETNRDAVAVFTLYPTEFVAGSPRILGVTFGRTFVDLSGSEINALTNYIVYDGRRVLRLSTTQELMEQLVPRP